MHLPILVLDLSQIQSRLNKNIWSISPPMTQHGDMYANLVFIIL